jgi:hypothetical protein
MNKELVIALVALLSAAAVFYNTVEQKDDFLLWKEKFGYNWSQEEDSYRRLVYLKNI